MEGLEPNMELLRAVELGEVRNDKLGFLQCGGKALEVHRLGHLDLLIHAATLVLAHPRDITDGECVGAFDGDLPRFAAIESLHALQLGEGDVVSIFEAMSSLV